MDNTNTETKSSYSDAQKRATQKYRANNKEKVNEQRKKYYQHRKETDPSFLEYKRQKAREYYQKKKGLTAEQQEDNNVEQYFESLIEQHELMKEPEPLPEPLPEQPKNESVVDPDHIEVVEVPVKKTRKARTRKVTYDV